MNNREKGEELIARAERIIERFVYQRSSVRIGLLPFMVNGVMGGRKQRKLTRGLSSVIIR